MMSRCGDCENCTCGGDERESLGNDYLVHGSKSVYEIMRKGHTEEGKTLEDKE